MKITESSEQVVLATGDAAPDSSVVGWEGSHICNSRAGTLGLAGLWMILTDILYILALLSAGEVATLRCMLTTVGNMEIIQGGLLQVCIIRKAASQMKLKADLLNYWAASCCV